MSTAKHTLKPTIEETSMARDLLSQIDNDNYSLSMQFTMGQIKGKTIQPTSLTENLTSLMREILVTLSEGQGIVVMTEEAELSTFQASQILNVSHSFLIRLLEQGEIPYYWVGSSQYVTLKDILSYQEESLKRSYALLDEITAIAQEDGLYD